jgi:hypothetical protein
MRKFTIAATATALTVVAVGGCALAQGQQKSVSVQPAATKIATVSESASAQLNVPAGQKVVATMEVEQGTQVYTCTNKSWTLLEPAAILRSGNTRVLHTKGPQWISPEDGSAVTGTVVASEPRSGAVPELLLKSTANRGTGLFGSVDFIQRLNTEGGVAPAGSCAAGTQTAVRYSAEYRFYAPDTTTNK